MTSENRVKMTEQPSDGWSTSVGLIIHGRTPPWRADAADLVENFVPTRHELGVIARSHYERATQIEFFWRISQQTSSVERREKEYAYARLRDIRGALGDADYEKEVEELMAAWDAKFAKADQDEAALTPCVKCGAARDFLDEAFIKSGHCHGCDDPTQD